MENEEANMADVKILDLLHYVEKQWFRNSVRKPQDICAYRRLVRTNNDVEGYHRRLNQRVALDNPSVYKFLEVGSFFSRLDRKACKLGSCPDGA